MKLYAYSHTAAGIARRAQPRGLPAPTVEAQQPETPPAQSPVARNVIRFIWKPRLVQKPSPPPIPEDKRIPKTDVQRIISDIAHKHGLTAADLMRKDRHRKIVLARDEAIAAVKDAKPALSLHQLSRLFGCGHDHTSMLTALRRQAERTKGQ